MSITYLLRHHSPDCGSFCHRNGAICGFAMWLPTLLLKIRGCRGELVNLACKLFHLIAVVFGQWSWQNPMTRQQPSSIYTPFRLVAVGHFGGCDWMALCDSPAEQAAKLPIPYLVVSMFLVVPVLFQTHSGDFAWVYGLHQGPGLEGLERDLSWTQTY